jgi:hypothetical protein
MQQSQLPLCIQYIQALGPSIVAVIVALIAGCIAWRQWRTAHYRLLFDLFDRRLAVYKATRKIISHVGLGGQVEKDDFFELDRAVEGAEFLFRGEAREFFRKIRIMCEGILILELIVNKSAAEDEKQRLTTRKNEMLSFIGQYNAEIEKFENMFRPYLDLSTIEK